MQKKRVLFVCIHNSARSQMAQGWLRHLAGDLFEAESAGIEPGKLNPIVVEAMTRAGVDISHHRAKGVEEIVSQGKSYDFVIAVCDKEAAERCPIFPGSGVRLHWNFQDPSAATGSHEEKLAVTCQVRDEICSRIQEWVSSERNS